MGLSSKNLLGLRNPPLQDFRLILLWPLAVRFQEPTKPMGRHFEPKSLQDAFVTCLDSPPNQKIWQRLDSPLSHARPTDALEDPGITPEEYNEFAYFSPAVQRLLYGLEDTDSPVILYRHKKVARLTLQSQPEGEKNQRFSFAVDRLQLHLFPTGDLILVTELHWQGAPQDPDSPKSLTLDQMLDITEKIRHAYLPFFLPPKDDGESPWSPSMIHALDWIDHEGKAWPSDMPAKGNLWNHIQAAMTAMPSERPSHKLPLLPHWDRMLPSLAESGLAWHPLHDDRMMTLSYLRLDRPWTVRRADWIRLANVDTRRPDYPYASSFLDGFEKQHCYDRFWEPYGQSSLTSRSVFSSFAFTMLSSTHRESDFLEAHFRRHYFQMALIGLYQVTALRNLSDLLAQTVSDPLPKEHAPSPPQTRTEGSARHATRKILQAILHFTRTAWFPDLTNQIQGREMFALWRQHLGSDALYAQVLTEVKEVNGYLDREEDRDATQRAEKLNRTVAILGTTAIAVGFLGMNIIIPGKDDGDKSWFTFNEWLAGFCVLLATFGLVTLLPLLYRKLQKSQNRDWISSLLLGLCLGLPAMGLF